MLKKRIIALITGIALMVAVAGASVVVANTLVTSATPDGQTIANTCGSGGGC
jgi:hypothetical protein